MAAEAKPRRAVEPQKPLNQRRSGRGLENLVADESDALRDFFVAQGE